MSPRNDATEAQVRAADPSASTWVSANAGSGKTRVLTDRVARLLLSGTSPQKILCLTYTKAAASHMQNQLFARLGEWAMLDDETLSKKLSELGEDHTVFSPEKLRQARTLFARALEAPGGLKIQTIHSFCASLLRRFPLEAGVSPQFKEIDDRSGKRLRSDVLETLAIGPDTSAFDAMARYLSGEDPDALTQEIASNRTQFSRNVSASEIWKAFGLPADFDADTLIQDGLPGWEGEVLPDLTDALKTGSANDVKAAQKLSQIDLSKPSLDTIKRLEQVFLFGPKTKNPNCAKIGSFPTKATRDAFPDLIEAVEQLMKRIEVARARRQALVAAEKARALHHFARAFLQEYEARKQFQGWLDFDDLIHKARTLLTDSSTAQWVLFRLDGGIDHILVDEAQDTSPTQWDVVAKLAEEFTTGQGARDVERTIFVVGDEKQSIYSFQGADPAAFGEMRGHFGQQLERAGGRLEETDLLYSFRSAEPILRLVDNILANDASTGAQSTVTHRAFHTEQPGRIDLWPFIETDQKSERTNWYEPVDTLSPDAPSILLARQIAEQIAEVLDNSQHLPLHKGSRRIRPGDFLILVQRRSDLFHEIIKALKDKGLPVAGADRLKVGGELAVKDLVALLSFAATPEDDLSLASTLRSPLFGVSEGELYRIAHGRKGTLWQSLRASRDKHPLASEMLFDILAQADFLRPYEILERVLTRHNGRARLVARLGREAEDGIDALLAQALQYEQMEPPTLTGFLGWLAEADVDIKRQMDTLSDQIRVMTVHGAKGLESPIVILPDTAKRQTRNRNEICEVESGILAWKVPQDDSPPEIANAIALQNSKQVEERMRLLYVALTRAENWLIVCGAGDKGKGLESWYSQVNQGLDAVGAVPQAYFGETGKRYESENWEREALPDEDSSNEAAPPIPAWVASRPPKLVEAPKLVSPSSLGGAKAMTANPEAMDDAALTRGRQIHLLLEKLPAFSCDEWQRAAGELLSTGEDRATSTEISALFDEASRILKSPHLEHIFAPTTFSEIGISAPLPTLESDRMLGYIDRLIVEPDRILAVDFKTNAEVPDRPESVPDGLLRQMGAYSEALALIYPQKAIETAILWTRPCLLMSLPHEIVSAALKTTPTS